MEEKLSFGDGFNCNIDKASIHWKAVGYIFMILWFLEKISFMFLLIIRQEYSKLASQIVDSLSGPTIYPIIIYPVIVEKRKR